MKRSPIDGLALVAVRRSGIHGRGVFAKAVLPGRRKIGELGGELVRLPEARRSVEADGAIYLVELTRRLALDCRRGNAFRHLNHRCDANCYLRVLPTRVEVYTKRPLRKGEELTVDYGVTPHRGGMACRCGSPRCRGVI